MASKAPEYYVNGKNTWEIGVSESKTQTPLRYMDEPTKDGYSIDNAKDYSDDIDPHFSMGIYTKFFYLLATTPGWDTHKAFNVMVKANMDYWSSSTQNFEQAACGVMSSTKDYELRYSDYPVKDVASAFLKVGIDTKNCI